MNRGVNLFAHNGTNWDKVAFRKINNKNTLLVNDDKTQELLSSINKNLLELKTMFKPTGVEYSVGGKKRKATRRVSKKSNTKCKKKVRKTRKTK